MYVLTFVTQKGGSGKTTMLLNFAVIASKEKDAKVLVIDLDPQKSTLAWWESRNDNSIGILDVEGNKVETAVHLAKEKGFDYVFIDTPARAEATINAAIAVSDFCVLPCQPSLLDMRASKATVSTIEKLNKKGGFVITRANPRGYRVADAIEALKVHGLPVCQASIVDRTAYRDAYAYGEGVIEFEPEGKAAQEIKESWKWIKNKLNKQVRKVA